MKVLICPDSFKGSLSATDAANAIQNGIHKLDNKINTNLLPLADGGEGTAFLLAQVHQLKKADLKLQTLSGIEDVISYYHNDNEAYFDAAEVIGWSQVPNDTPLIRRDSKPLGFLIKALYILGFKKQTICLGGTGTHDLGLGMLQVLGVKFFDNNGDDLEVTLSNLNKIGSFSSDNTLPDLQLTALCDVKTKLLDSIDLYANQKGATDAEIETLKIGFSHFAKMISKSKKVHLDKIDSTGAAGGIAFALLAFFKAELKMGFDELQLLYNIEKKVKEVDIVISGEGCVNESTLKGKVVGQMAKLAFKHEIPFAVVCGSATDEELASKLNALAIIQLVGPDVDENEALKNAAFHIADASHTLFDYLQKNE